MNVKEDQRPWPRVQILPSMMLSHSLAAGVGSSGSVQAERGQRGAAPVLPWPRRDKAGRGAFETPPLTLLLRLPPDTLLLCFALLCFALPPSIYSLRSLPAPLLLLLFVHLRLPTLNTRTAPYASSSLHPTLRHCVCLLHTMPSQRYERVCSPASGRWEYIIPLREPPRLVALTTPKLTQASGSRPG